MLEQDTTKPRFTLGVGVAVAGVVWAAVAVVVIAVMLAVADSDIPREPSVETQTRDVLDGVWLGLDSSERIDFCAEARAAGYQVVVSEMMAARRLDRREAGYWLEDRCG